MIEAKKSKNFGRLTINGEEYDVYLAKSEEQKKRGLQGVMNLDSDEGMLFFINESEPEETVFHTHNCHFPIDILFLDDNFKILDIKTEYVFGIYFDLCSLWLCISPVPPSTTVSSLPNT